MNTPGAIATDALTGYPFASSGEAAMAELTPYDTGEVLEPKLWPIGAYQSDHPDGQEGRLDSYGRVDFDDDEGASQFTLRARPGKPGDRFKVVIEVWPLGIEDDEIEVVIHGRSEP